jgi:hypothetical protein
VQWLLLLGVCRSLESVFYIVRFKVVVVYFINFILVMSVPEKILLRKLKKREHKKLKFLEGKAEVPQTRGIPNLT